MDAQSGLSVQCSQLKEKPALVTWEYVASAISNVSTCSVVATLLVSVAASLSAYLLVSVAAPVVAYFFSSLVPPPAYLLALVAGFLVPCDAPALSCSSCCSSSSPLCTSN